jgi:hypothetical protein
MRFGACSAHSGKKSTIDRRLDSKSTGDFRIFVPSGRSSTRTCLGANRIFRELGDEVCGGIHRWFAFMIEDG